MDIIRYEQYNELVNKKRRIIMLKNFKINYNL